MSSLAERYSDWIAARHRQVIGASAVLTAVGLGLAVTLPLQTEFNRLLPEDEPSVSAMRELSVRKPATAVIQVGIASPSPAATERFAHDLAAALRRDLPPHLVREVDDDDAPLRGFLWEHRLLYADRADLLRARDALQTRADAERLRHNPFYFDLDEGEVDDRAAHQALVDFGARVDRARADAERPPGYVAEQGRLRLVVVRCPFGDGEPRRAEEVLRALSATVERLDPRAYHPRLEVGFDGDPVIAAREHDLVLRDVALSVVACFALVLLALLATLRAPRAVLALALTLLAGCAWTFGFTRIWIGHLNSSTAFLGSVVAGNGINFGIILLSRYLELRRGGATHLPSLSVALARTARPTLIAAAAAGAAYLSLIITSFRGFSELGVIAGAGMLFCWIASYLLLPALLTRFDRRAPLASPMRTLDRDLPFVAQRRLSRVRRVVLIAVAGAFAIALHGAVQLSRHPFEEDLRALRSRSLPQSSVGRWSDRLGAAFGRVRSGGFYLGADRPEQIATLVRAVDDAQDKVPAEQRLFARVDALPRALPGSLAEQRERIAIAVELRALADRIRPFVEDGSDEARLLDTLSRNVLCPIAFADLPPTVRRAFTERDGRVGLLMALYPGPGYGHWSLPGIERAVDFVRSLPLDGARLSGPEVVFVDIMAAVRRDGPRASLLALVLVLVLLAAALGPSRDLAITVAALLVGLFGMLGLMQLCGVRLNFLNYIAIPITVGIGVDYPFNVIVRLRQDRAAGRAPWRGLAATGRAVVLCSLTTSIGYAVLLLSDTGAIRSFGAAAALGELCCVAAALVVTPALFLFRRRNG
jgi:predicted exporter